MPHPRLAGGSGAKWAGDLDRSFSRDAKAGVRGAVGFGFARGLAPDRLDRILVAGSFGFARGGVRTHIRLEPREPSVPRAFLVGPS